MTNDPFAPKGRAITDKERNELVKQLLKKTTQRLSEVIKIVEEANLSIGETLQINVKVDIKE